MKKHTCLTWNQLVYYKPAGSKGELGFRIFQNAAKREAFSVLEYDSVLESVLIYEDGKEQEGRRWLQC
jgi:hypothetical protein